MVEHVVGGTAVEAPVRVVRPRSAPRRHRWLTGTSSLALFVCLFVPAVDGCSTPIVPLDAPPFWVPYLFGGAFVVAALARTRLGYSIATLAVRLLAWLVIVGGLSMLGVAPALGVIELALGLLFLAAIGWRGSSEHRLALALVAVGATSSLWFALWSLTPGALLGVYLSLASALGLFVGGLVWFAELEPLAPGRLPPAVIHHHQNDLARYQPGRSAGIVGACASSRSPSSASPCLPAPPRTTRSWTSCRPSRR